MTLHKTSFKQSSLPSVLTLHSFNTRKSQVQSLNEKFDDLQHQVGKVSPEKLYFTEHYKESAKEAQLKKDPQIAAFKLKQLQNDMQIEQADQELQHRISPKKKYSPIKNTRIKPIPQLIKTPSHYLEEYSHIDKPLQIILNKAATDQTEEDLQQIKQKSENAEVHFYKELKSKPKVLQYVMDRINRERIAQWQQTNQEIKKKLSMSDYTNNIKEQYASTVELLRNVPEDQDPEKIIEKRLPKFYSKESNLTQEQLRTSSQELHKIQQKLCNNTHISQQSKLKLREKFTSIMRSIGKTAIKVNLPKLSR